MILQATQSTRSTRRGYVLIAVLLVIAVLALVAYRFTDAMTSEYRAGVRTADMAQARAAATSGIVYTMAMLSDRETRQLVLGDLYNNPGAFQDIAVRSDPNSPKKDARFSIISVTPVVQGVYEQHYGVVDEGGKVNINALIAADKSGEVLFNALMKFPNMTEDIADSIVDWVDADDTPRPNGAESDTYQGYGQPYRAKNGPLSSLDELLLVKGVTPQLLYGTDRNRNGLGDDGGSSVDRGWSDYLTIYSREVNVDSTGTLRVWINGDDIVAIYDAMLAQGVSDAMAAYIVAAKIYTRTQLDASGNPIAAGGGKGGGGTGGGKSGKGGKGGGGSTQKTRVGAPSDLIAAVEKSLADPDALAPKSINSIMDLMNTRVTLPRTGDGGGAFGTTETVVVNSPLNDPAMLGDVLPMLLDKTCAKEAVEMIPRINVNTAPREVLLGIPGVTDSDADAIIGGRDGLVPDDPATTTAAWLVTTAGITPAKFKAMEQYVTGSTMVYRVESVGYLAGGSPVVRIEAIIDTNMGAPRILYYRELTDLDSPRAYQPQAEK